MLLASMLTIALDEVSIDPTWRVIQFTCCLLLPMV
jgi:hypothetical protein